MRSKWLGSLFVGLLTLGTWASTGLAQQVETDDMAVTVRYFGETLIHAGGTLGAEAYLQERGHAKIILAPNIGYYVHPRNHHGAFVDLEFGGRWTTDFGLFGDAFAGLGYFHRIPAGNVVAVEGDEVRGTTNTGNPNVMGAAWLGVGWDLEQNDLAPVDVHLRLGGFGEFPFNNVILPHTAAQLGAAYKF